jgi:hypothetical protein
MRLAVAMDGSAPIAYVARDLSAGGALLTGGPALPIGREARVMFPILGRDLILHGRVLRSATDAAGVPCIGVCFRGVPTFVQDLIQNHVLLAQQRSDD